MSKFAILLNGELTITQRLVQQLEGAKFIAADAGIVHAANLGVTPMSWIGDFDSIDDAVVSDWKNVPRQVHPSDKDVTDGALAVGFALGEGATEIVLVGAMGGRSDMVMCHLTQLVELKTNGVDCFATSGNEEAWPIVEGLTSLSLPENTTLSLVGFDALKGVKLFGVKWPLTGQDIEFGNTIGLSNVVEGEVEINVRSGRGVAIAGGLM